MQITARDEHSEMAHFDAHVANALVDKDRIQFSRDLEDQCDAILLKKGIEELGDINGKKILILGCGVARETWYLTERGAIVYGMDISPNSVTIAAIASKKHGLEKSTAFQAMSCYCMGYKDQSFDGIYGHAILHHLDLDLLGSEIARVLKTGGKAVFTEPFDENPVLRFVRDHVWYPGKHRVPGEKAMRYRDMRKLAKSFSKHYVLPTQLFAMLDRLFPHPGLLKILTRFDSAIMQLLPPLRHLCRYAVVVYVK